MRRNSVKTFCFSLAVVLVTATGAAAQSVKQVVAVPTGGFGNTKPAGILVFFESYRTLPPVLTEPRRYTLFQFNPQRMEEPVVDLTRYVWALPTIECHPIGGYCELRSNDLAVSLDPSRSYILGIDGIGPQREVFTFKVTEKASIKGAALPTDARNSIQVTAPVAIRPSSTSNYVILKRDVLKIARGSVYLIPDSESIPVVDVTQQAGPAQNTLNLTLGEKLSEGRVHSLTVTSGLQTDL